MRRVLGIILVFAMILGASVNAGAAMVTITHDYGFGFGKYTAAQGDGPYGYDFITLKDNNSVRFADVFSMANLGLQSISFIKMNVTHKYNDFYFTFMGGVSEWWLTELDNHSHTLGSLSDSENGWVTDTFLFESRLVDEIWENQGFLVHFSEETWFNDCLLLDEITLSICGEEIVNTPVPAAAWLLGSGLLGLMGLRRRFMS